MKTSLRALPWLLAASLLLVNGCAVILAGGAAGTVSGLEYTYENVARKSFTTEIAILKNACTLALEEMAIEATDPIPTEEGFRIYAVTPKLHIRIDIDRVTDQVAQIRVNAKRGYGRKDLATADEILQRTELAIGRLKTRTAKSTEATKTRLIRSSPSTETP